MSGTPAASPATIWPLRGTPDYARLDPAWRAALVERFEHDLRVHVADAWFPRCVDEQDGGFWAGFDATWRRRGDGHRMLEFQARQTRTAARLGLAFPSQAERWRRIALHGFDFLAATMADAERGGWYWQVDRRGQPLHGATKHAHGTSYLLTTFVEVHRLTGDERALHMLDRVIEWLEDVHHDDEHGGYHGWVTRDGGWIATRAQVPAGVRAHEPLGHGLGLKDANVTSDVLEGYVAVAAARPTPRIEARLAELYDVLVQRLLTPDGGLHYMTYADWSPVPTLERFGYVLQQVFRLPAAGGVLARTGEALEHARRLLDHAVRRAWDERRGAFVTAAAGAEPDSISGHSLRLTDFEWWTQTEALRGLMLLTVTDPSSQRHRVLVDRLLEGIARGFLDRRRGGWHSRPTRDVPLRRRLRGEPAKGDDWKDASHEADAYLAVLRMLRGVPDGAPVERDASG